MSVYAIQGVSEALRSVLLNNMDTDNVPVTFWAPGETIPSAATGRRINLFLYHVIESPHFKDDDWEIISPQILCPPPLSLILSYLLTPYSGVNQDNLDAHLLLADAMRVLNEHPVIEPAYLRQELRSSIEQIKVIPEPLSIDDLGKIWGSIESGPRLSVGYEVSVVQIEPTEERERRISRVREVRLTAVPTKGPPRVEGITPEAGPIGTTVTVTGFNFDGQYVEVVIDGQIVESITVVSPSTATFQIPDGLEAGYHQIVVIVNGRRSNGVNFVVTPYLEMVTPRQGAVNGPIDIQLLGQGITTNINLYAPDGTVSNPSSSVSGDEITFQIPSGASTGVYEISVLDAGHESNREPFFATPYIGTLEPREGITGTRVAIHGRGLAGTSEVTIGDGTITATVIPPDTTDTMVEFVVPEEDDGANALASGEYEVSVTVDGHQSNRLSFRLITQNP